LKWSSRSVLRLLVLSLTKKLGCAATAAAAGLQTELGQRRGKREGEKKSFAIFFKRIKQFEFKLEFEFKQS
jgi:hypothetical protein